METTLQPPYSRISTHRAQPWIYSRWLDGAFILAPPFAALLLVALLPGIFQHGAGDVNLAWWVVLVLFVDVSHVYSTIYRTYFDSAALRQRPALYLLVPVLSWVGGVALYMVGSLVFWRVMAYLAVYHFVRQQYGFLRIYSRKETQPRWGRVVDNVMIYAATIYPLCYWHLTGPLQFNWFVEHDFFYLPAAGVAQTLGIAYGIIVVVYTVKVAWQSIQDQFFNLPKQALVLGTALSWYFGIVYFKGDLAFTLLNVVSHGIPYMALIWAHGRKHYYRPAGGKSFLGLVFSNRGIWIFLGVIGLLAFVEEGCWDGFIWREHTRFFSLFQSLPALDEGWMMALVVSLLAVPQVTHYVLDGFIWRMQKGKNTINF